MGLSHYTLTFLTEAVCHLGDHLVVSEEEDPR